MVTTKLYLSTNREWVNRITGFAYLLCDRMTTRPKFCYRFTHFGRKDIGIKNLEFMASELAFGALYVWMQEVPYTKGAIQDSQ